MGKAVPSHTTDGTNQDGTSDARSWDEVLAEAVKVLTEAARLRRPVLEQAASAGWEAHPTRTEPADWAEFVTLAVAGAAAEIVASRTVPGRKVSYLVRGRPGRSRAKSPAATPASWLVESGVVNAGSRESATISVRATPGGPATIGTVVDTQTDCEGRSSCWTSRCLSSEHWRRRAW